ncbi:MAG: hypothetical protein ACKVRN_01160 [Pyrinomonadaceae bacterium]
MKTEDQHHPDATEELIIQSLAKLDGKALGVAIGLLMGLGIFVATNLLIFKGGEVIGPNLALLNQFFIGYEITFVGSLIGMIYGIIVGFAIGWLIAAIRNFVVMMYMQIIKVKGSMAAVNDYIDNP